jgi:LysR family transcriptional regulator, glycine cleavage system transcriptional activator
MLHSQTHLRTRPIGAGNLRAFEAVARHLNFRAAAEEMALTQSAVSRQIQSLEEEVGTQLFSRHTRSVELTAAGMGLLGAVAPSLERIDSSVRQIRTSVGRKHVALTTFASFASMWLIPRLEAFQKSEPDIDFRIDASDVSVDMETADVDIALRYGPARSMPAHAIRLFGEQLTPAASPWLLKSIPSIQSPADFANCTLIEAGDAHSSHLDWLSWRRWFDRQAELGGENNDKKAAELRKIAPKRWLYFNYAYQMAQASLSGQGVVLARTPLVAEHLARGDLVEILPKLRMDSPMAFWLILSPRQRLLSTARPEVTAFCAWLKAQAAETRRLIGEMPTSDVETGTLDD